MQARKLLIYSGLLVLLIILASFVFATILVWVRLLSDDPLSSGDSAAYPLLQSTVGLAISAVASSVALLLALRSVQSAEKERTIALLDIYQPEITALVEEANALQDRLRDVVLAMRATALAGAHLTRARLFEDYRRDRVPGDALRAVLAARKARAIDAHRAACGKDPDPEDLPEHIALADDPDDYFGEVIYRLPGFDRAAFAEQQRAGFGHVPYWPQEQKLTDEQLSVPAAAQTFDASLDTLRRELEGFVTDVTSPRSGLLHTVLSRRFAGLVTGPFAPLGAHLAQPVNRQDSVAQQDGTVWPVPDLAAEGYHALTRVPALFGRHLPLAFLRSADMPDALLPADALPDACFHSRLRILDVTKTEGEAAALRGFPLRGPATPEALGLLLGRFLPCITHFKVAQPTSILMMQADRHFHDSPGLDDLSADEIAAMYPADLAESAGDDLPPETPDEWVSRMQRDGLVPPEDDFPAEASPFMPPPEEDSHHSPAFYRHIDHYPDDDEACAFSPVFVWVIPLLVRLISPIGVLRELTDAMADLDLDGDLLQRHLRLQMLRLYSYEAFGDPSSAPVPVPDRLGHWAAERARANPARDLWDDRPARS
ncbi:hypothetical protein [Pseudotabrizicola algicola]|uniref:Uncharacterized protein n=1 Tax=Pseudotabrizicola algicola TaxID=2709381 RepID=A0A6B3RTS1_9RHOB|nr:hypothetical protein [Pseudotabrizicola algicola]NEX47335.1 hypothetical protein [Pseudotabrizicola algicola]